mmetsp:Transcript_9824/g.29561  ORF Transcript_9824/g.29561 Transcript_9824/m.29561 type:complete len:287 (-) Transcript_9824:1375-2235(-)
MVAHVTEAQLSELGVLQPGKTAAGINNCLASTSGHQPAPLVWQALTESVLTPEQPFKLHQLLLSIVSEHWDAVRQGPMPLWIPTTKSVQETNLARFMATLQRKVAWRREASGDPARDVSLLHRLSCELPEVVLPGVLERLNLCFDSPPTRVVDVSAGAEHAVWLPDARFNIAACALSGPDDRTAITWAHEAEPATLRHVSLGVLRRNCTAVAEALRARDLSPGDAVAIDMPMTVESVVIYLGIILAGCAACTVADSFAPPEIAARLRIAACKLVFTQACSGPSGSS